MKLTKLNEIHDRLQGKSFLFLVETSIYHIPERLEEYDPNMFICFNSLIQEYEVHSLRNKGDTHALSIPWAELDQRTLDFVADRDQNRRPLKDIIREIDKRNEEREKRREKYRRSEINSIAREVRPIFKRFAEEVY